MRRTKFYPNYGYVTEKPGKGIFDFIQTLFKNTPDVVKTAVQQVAKSGAKAAGDRVGSLLAKKIAPREKILQELKLKPEEKTSLPNLEQYGLGRKKKIRGAGIKVLI